MSKPKLMKRLTNLEAIARESARSDGRKTEEQWLKWFAGPGARYLANEPDFPKALEFYRNAIREAAATNSPPWEAPDNFMRDKSLNERRIAWRGMRRYGKVGDGMMWLFEMIHRVFNGGRPVTEAEFRDHEAWFQANEDLIPRDGFTVGERCISRANIRYGLAKGPMASGVTALVDDLRLLRTACHRPVFGGDPIRYDDYPGCKPFGRSKPDPTEKTP